MFNEEEAGRQLAKIASADGCTISEALQRSIALYTAAQMAVWNQDCLLGIVDKDYKILGFLHPDSFRPNDPNYEIDLD